MPLLEKTIKTAKKKDWEKICNEINYHTPSKSNALTKYSQTVVFPSLKIMTLTLLLTNKKQIILQIVLRIFPAIQTTTLNFSRLKMKQKRKYLLITIMTMSLMNLLQ